MKKATYKLPPARAAKARAFFKELGQWRTEAIKSAKRKKATGKQLKMKLK